MLTPSLRRKCFGTTCCKKLPTKNDNEGTFLFFFVSSVRIVPFWASIHLPGYMPSSLADHPVDVVVISETAFP
jgi:hypothetical protein